MKIKGKYIKRGTIITVVSIIVLTLATMNVSYSSFFSVQTQTNVPVITAGNLNVTATIEPTPTQNGEGLMPSDGYSSITDANSPINGNQNTDYIKETLKITNSSNINIKIGALISDTGSGNAQPQSVVIAIQKNNQWLSFGSGSNKYYVKLNQLTKSDSAYPIINDIINNGTSTVSYDIYMWLASDTVETDSEKSLNYSISVKAIPAEGQDGSNTVPDVSTNS